MKIVYVVHKFPPDNMGGTSVAVYQVAKDMRRRGHRVWVLAPQRWTDVFSSIGFFDEKVDGLSVRRLIFNPELSPNPILYGYYNPVIYRYVKDYLKQVSPDIIHIYGLYTLTSSIIDAAKELAVPEVLTLTDFWFICPRSQLLRWDGMLCENDFSWQDCIYCLKEEGNSYDKITKAFNREMMHIYIQEGMPGNINNSQILSLLAAAAGRAPFLRSQLGKIDRIVCRSSFLSRVFLRKNYFPNGFALVSPGTSRPQRLLSKKGQISNITFGYFGGGREHKGAHVLLEAFRQIKSPNVNLKLYRNLPNTEYVKELRQIAKGDERIDFMGNFSRTEFTKVLAGIDMLVMPSIWPEAYGLSILEAFANKIPVIATDIGGIPEIVHDGHNGLLFKRGDVLDLKKKMERIINEPGLIQKLRENIPRVKSINEECDELLDIYKKLLRQK